MLIAAKANRRIAMWLRQFLVTISVFALALTALRAFADEDDVLNIGIGGTVTHDSNLFRLPDSAGPVSDTIYTGYVGLHINKPYAQQRFLLDVTETVYRYEKSANLDFDGLGYRGAWLWHLGPRISGTLAAERKEELVAFDQTIGSQRNVRTSDSGLFSLDALIFGGWHMLLGISARRQTSEQPVLGEPDFRSLGIGLGLSYVARSGSSVTVTRRSTKGEYLQGDFDPADSEIDDYREDEYEVGASWILSGRSTLTGRVAWIERHHEIFTNRDFSGPAGELVYAWTPKGKLNFAFSAGQTIRPYRDLFSRYLVEDTLSLEPTWRSTERITVRMRLQHVRTEYRGGLVARPGGERRDSANNALLGVDWRPRRSITFGALLERLQRSSNDALAEFDATVATISASLLF